MAEKTDTLLEVRDLHTCFKLEGGETAFAIRGIDLDIAKGEILGIVGESGCGKSVTALSIMRLIPDPPGHIDRGSIRFGGRDLLKISYEEMRRVRGRDIAMIFQEPMTSLNPVFRIGMQVAEPLQIHQGLGKKKALAKAADMLSCVGIPDARKRLSDYPHQFSGGMRQRVMIAMALVCNPALLIADEPTTALDVTIQAQILDLMLELQGQREGSAIVLITHDLAVVAETCTRVIVMYGGRIQEVAPVKQIFLEPLHPYTRGLLASIPGAASKGKPLQAIPGNVPGILDLPKACRFNTRCKEATDRCFVEEPALVEHDPGHLARCHLLESSG